MGHLINLFLGTLAKTQYYEQLLLLIRQTSASGSEFLPDFNHIFDTAKGILTVVSLIAFIAALVALCFVYYNYTDRKKLKDNPNEYVAIAERLHIQFNQIPEHQRADVTRHTLNTRIRAQAIMSGTLVALVIVIGIIMVSINKENVADVRQEKNQRKALRDSIDQIKNLEVKAEEAKGGDLKKIDQLILETGSILKKVQAGNDTVIKVDYHYFVAEIAAKLNNLNYEKDDSLDLMDILRYNIDHPDPHQASTDAVYAKRHLQFILEKLSKVKAAIQ